MAGVADSIAANYGLTGELPPPLSEAFATVPETRIPAGTVLFAQGSACRGFPLLIEGCIRVSKAAENGREIVLYRVLPGESCVISSSCLLGGVGYCATGIAEQPLRMRVLPNALFDRLIDQVPTFRRFVFQLFGARIADLMRLVEEVAFRRLDARLAELLMARSADSAQPIRTTHQQLADDLGSVREIVSRILNQFADEQLVRLARERIEVADPVRLAARGKH